MDNRKGNDKKSVIRIRRKHKYFNINNLLVFICFMIISIMVGLISSEFIISKIIGATLTSNTSNVEDDLIIQKKINNTLSIVSKSLVTISCKKESLSENSFYEDDSTGVILDREGYIATDYSKIKNVDKIYVRLSSIGSEPIAARIVTVDEELDIAIVKIDVDNGAVKPVRIKDNKNIKEGELVLSVGNANSDNYVGMSSLGIISIRGDKIKASGHEYDVIGTDSVINDKNNMGVICNLKGEVIAIGSTKVTANMNNDGLYYGISCSQIRSLIKKE